MTNPKLKSPGCFVYVTEVDISVDNGPGINEREFVSALLKSYPEEVFCVLPRPSRPAVFHDARIRYTLPHNGSPWGYFRYLGSSLCKVRKLIQEQQVVALVFRPGGTPVLPFLLARLYDKPVLLKKLGLYSIFGDEVTRSFYKNAVSRSLLPFYRSVFRSCVAADVESAAYVDWLHERFGIERSRMRVIPNGVNTGFFRPRAGTDSGQKDESTHYAAVIGYVGALSRIRRVDSLLRAFASLVETNGAHDLGLVLVGGGSDQASLELEAEQLGIDTQVKFVGPVPYAEVPGWVRRFDIAVDTTAVLMRTGHGVRLGSFSQKIGQYLASGVPVVAWRCPDTEFLDAERVGATARYPDEHELAEALRRLVAAIRVNRVEMTERARRTAVVRYDSERLANERVAWWRRVLRDE